MGFEGTSRRSRGERSPYFRPRAASSADYFLHSREEVTAKGGSRHAALTASAAPAPAFGHFLDLP